MLGPTFRRHQNIFLMGYRGCGKSTVGKLLARQLRRRFVDTDCLIEERAGKTIRQIFDADGEPAFRELEEQIVREVAERKEALVIGLGGGAILRPSNQKAIINGGAVIYLRASAESLFARISQDATSFERRPNLTNRGGFNEVIEILAIREPIYQKLSQFTVDSDHKTPDQVVAEIEGWINS
ncbi:MAG: shikimate kinase [Planctomycetales bacterium]|nr:shikimate kinase [Planctomycetales bacterium]